MEFAGRHFLLIVENEAVPFDRRVWLQALTLKNEGANVSAICPIFGKDNKKYENIDGIDIFRYKLPFSDGTKKGYIKEYGIAFVKTFMMFHKVLFKKGKINVIHVANPPDIFWPLAIYCRMLKIKFIFDEHDLSPETYISRFELKGDHKSFLVNILQKSQWLSYKYSHAVISTNETYKQEAVKIYPPNKEKLFIVRNGPDTRKIFATEPNHELKKGKRYLFGFIGVMAVQDGVDYIINAINYLVKEKNFKDFITYLIGSGDDIVRLKNMVREFELENFVVFTERIPDRPAFEILSTADVCLSPDPYNPLNDKSTMTKVMEYMTLGKPIVSFKLKEAIYSAQDAALYVENNDYKAFAEGILKIITDRSSSKIMGDKGKKRVEEELSWQIQSRILIDAYRFVLKNYH